MKRVLILGASSMIGHQLFKYLNLKNIKVYGTSRNQKKSPNLYYFDPVKNLNFINTIIKKIKPNCIINTIGIIKHRKQINDFKNTIFLNSILPHEIAKISNRNKIKFIHLSKDCVFSGKKGNYSETDIPDAKDMYGISKKLGEINYKNCLTLRTSFIGYELNNKTGLFEWVLNYKNKKIDGFSNAFYNGFTTLELSKIIYKLIQSNIPIEGLYNLSSKKISKYKLLCLIINCFNLPIKVVKKATFFCDRTLNSRKFFKKIEYKVPNWDKMILDMRNLENDFYK